MKNFSTLSELFLFQEANFKNDKAFVSYDGSKEKTLSNHQFSQITRNFAYGLKAIGLQKEQTVAIFIYQSPIWLASDFATVLVGGISVPIFSDISLENLIFQLEDSDVKILFVDSQSKLELLKNQKIGLQKIITYGFTASNVDDYDFEFLTFEELLEIGKEFSNNYALEAAISGAKSGDVATIIYTSGSTGNPKGVEITHDNLVTQVKSAAKLFPLQEKEVALSFLPLAHIFENMVIKFYLAQGVSIYFIEDIKRISSMMKTVKPSIMTVVPRFLEKVYAKIHENINNSRGTTKIIGKIALKLAIFFNPDHKNIFVKLMLGIFDRLVYAKIRNSLGGNFHTIICGGAATPNYLERFFNNIGVNLFIGYGLTETSPVIAANCNKSHKIGTVGKLFDGVEVKIAADSELLVKGCNVMKGYHKNEARNKEVFIDGWFATGDLARIDDEGFLIITGRKKELFKTATGKYVRPIPIEASLVQAMDYLSGALIIAEGKKFVAALLFIDFETIFKIKTKLLLSQISNDDFLKSVALQDYTKAKIDRVNASLNRWEKIHKFCIITNDISIKSGDITPSMKLRRSTLEAKYKQQIDNFYH